MENPPTRGVGESVPSQIGCGQFGWGKFGGSPWISRSKFGGHSQKTRLTPLAPKARRQTFDLTSGFRVANLAAKLKRPISHTQSTAHQSPPPPVPQAPRCCSSCSVRGPRRTLSGGWAPERCAAPPSSSKHRLVTGCVGAAPTPFADARLCPPSPGGYTHAYTRRAGRLAVGSAVKRCSSVSRTPVTPAGRRLLFWSPSPYACRLSSGFSVPVMTSRVVGRE